MMFVPMEDNCCALFVLVLNYYWLLLVSELVVYGAGCDILLLTDSINFEEKKIEMLNSHVHKHYLAFLGRLEMLLQNGTWIQSGCCYFDMRNLL